MRNSQMLRISRISVVGLALGATLGLAGCSKTPPDPAPSADLPAGTATAQGAATPPQPECFTETYKHPKADGHARASDCLNHRNLIRFAREARDPRSVCVRVGGTPVRFKTVPAAKGKGVAGVVFGPIAGPETIVTVRYCARKMKCDDDCKIPKDEFMAAIGGEGADEEASAGKGARVAKWDPSDNTDADVSDEVERELRRELHGDPDVKPFEGWKSGGATPACSQGKG